MANQIATPVALQIPTQFAHKFLDEYYSWVRNTTGDNIVSYPISRESSYDSATSAGTITFYDVTSAFLDALNDQKIPFSIV